jgi:hypothetical protein
VVYADPLRRPVVFRNEEEKKKERERTPEFQES